MSNAPTNPDAYHSGMPAANLHTAVIDSQYLPPIETMARLMPFKRIRFEAHEHWVKRSYRNRAEVAGPHGRIRMSVPLDRFKLVSSGERRSMQEIRIAYAEPWLREHWQTLEAGYRRSPYFEYYEDRFEPVFNARYETLLERNMALFRFLAEALGMDWDIGLTDAWHRHVSMGQVDLRDAVRPAKGRPDPFYTPPVYPQVFEDRHGFLPGLSIVDVLLNEGPKTRDILEQALV